MILLAEAAKIKGEIEKLESARKDCFDTRIQEVIEFRIEERRLKLRQIELIANSPRQAPPLRHRP
jgi:hypothetical protein